MKRLLSLAFLLVTFLQCNENKDTGVPSPAIQASAEANQLSVEVTVPSGHHAYLDSGKEGNLIPVTFDFQQVANIEEVSKPQGNLEEISGARILKATGTFVFESVNPIPADLSFRVRTQICDDVSGICYRPEWHDVSL